MAGAYGFAALGRGKGATARSRAVRRSSRSRATRSGCGPSCSRCEARRTS